MAFIDELIELPAGGAKVKVLQSTHPVYDRYAREWATGMDAYDGAGGFLDGSELWQFLRETHGDFQKRKAQARYHNYAATLVDIYIRHITSSIERSTTDEALTEWWKNVDGQGRTIDRFMEGTFACALSAGYSGTLIDRSTLAARGPSQADDRESPYLVPLSALSILDWRTDRNGLAAIKIAESPPPVGLDQPVDPEKRQYLLWDRERWARFDDDGKRIGDIGENDLGFVPVEFLRPRPSRKFPFIGKALVTPSVIRALYNRASEEDLVLRDQAFSLFVVSLPIEATSEDMEKVRAVLAEGIGTKSATVIKGDSEFQTADMAVSEAIRNNQSFLIHELYRMAHMRFQRDGLQGESGEAIRLQRQDLEQTLLSFAGAMHDHEMGLVRGFYAWTAPEAEVEGRIESADVQIIYPDDFSQRDLNTELEAFAAATAMRLGETATKEIKKRVVTITLPDLAPDTLETVKQEIDGMAAAEAAGGGAAVDIRERAAARLREANIQVAA